MKIKDLNGKEITVTDLEAGIKQAGEFKEYRHAEPTPEQDKSDKERRKYWQDMYDKLLHLQSNHLNTK